MYVVVAYDIVNNRCRNRLAKRMVYYLHRVQKSVFEGEISTALYDRMINEITDMIDHQQDNIRIYSLCKYCKQQVLIFGTAFTPPGPEDDEVI